MMTVTLPAGRQLCVFCTYAMLIPATIVEARTPPGAGLDAPPDLRSLLPGPQLVEAARKAREDGCDIMINNNTFCGVYADMTFHGDTVCTAHMWQAIEQARGTLHW